MRLLARLWGQRSEPSQRIYCTYFDSLFLAQGIVMLRSLGRYDPGAAIHVLALDDVCARVLPRTFGRSIRVVDLSAVHQAVPELLNLSEKRPKWAYYATHKPAFVRFTMERQPHPVSVTFIDSDTAFFSDPAPMHQEIGDASVALCPHRFPKGSEHLAIYGQFNAGCIFWKNDVTARQCVADWQRDCLDWCEETPDEKGRFMNQGYLNQWPARYPGVHCIRHPGVNFAPWNIEGHHLGGTGQHLTVDGAPLIFYHFSGLLRDPDGCWYSIYPHRTSQFDLLLNEVYRPYLRAVEAERRRLTRVYRVAGTGSVRSWTIGPGAVRLGSFVPVP